MTPEFFDDLAAEITKGVRTARSMPNVWHRDDDIAQVITGYVEAFLRRRGLADMPDLERRIGTHSESLAGIRLGLHQLNTGRGGPRNWDAPNEEAPASAGTAGEGQSDSTPTGSTTNEGDDT